MVSLVRGVNIVRKEIGVPEGRVRDGGSEAFIASIETAH
jgi:hypothetical protein